MSNVRPISTRHPAVLMEGVGIIDDKSQTFVSNENKVIYKKGILDSSYIPVEKKSFSFCLISIFRLVGQAIFIKITSIGIYDSLCFSNTEIWVEPEGWNGPGPAAYRSLDTMTAVEVWDGDATSDSEALVVGNVRDSSSYLLPATVSTPYGFLVSLVAISYLVLDYFN